jgi:hypothetical protein
MAYTTIDDPTAYFQVKTYTGDGTTSNAQTFDGNTNMAPDMVWFKRRSGSANHFLYDSIRGANRSLVPNDVDAEATSGEQTTYLASFDSNGFTLGDDVNNVNASGETYVLWGWNTGASASSNTVGTENSTVSANTTAGFSIMTYAGTTAVDTYGHGLSQKPDMIIIKRRTLTGNWVVYHKSIGATKHLHLNTTDAEDTYQFMFNNTEPTNSLITLSDDGEVNKSGSNYVAYVFHSVKGYSKFSSYKGSGSSNGCYIDLGFRASFIMIKKSSGTENWSIYDTKRNVNGTANTLPLNSDNADGESGNTGKNLDILSNGVKIRTSNGELNASGTTYIFMAFAENPFVTSTGIPTTAR